MGGTDKVTFPQLFSQAISFSGQALNQRERQRNIFLMQIWLNAKLDRLSSFHAVRRTIGVVP
ncbi:MAG: hypothetical protein J2P54_14310, partial [Bradyrhizobiaceae bacterium]|nr:hypothetical protein [Bradyrhizobiaceae bacterium]